MNTQIITRDSTSVIANFLSGDPRNNLPGWAVTDTAIYSGPDGPFTNGVFTLTYSGDFDTSRLEAWNINLDGVDLGVLSDGNIDNDRFDNASFGDFTLDRTTYSASAPITDVELTSILGDGTVDVKFTDITPPGDWIDFVWRLVEPFLRPRKHTAGCSRGHLVGR